MTSLHSLLALQSPVLADGGMGTYYAALAKDSVYHCEEANVKNPALILKIHQDYLAAGASLLRTNTFAANTAALGLSPAQIGEILREGWKIACDAANSVSRPVTVAADIGPIFPNQEDSDSLQEYFFLIDTFLDCDARTFLFETFGRSDVIAAAASYIKSKKSDAEIIASFTFSADGDSREGIPAGKLMAQADRIPQLDFLGINCGIGPIHLKGLLQSIPPLRKPLSLMPNAGYPTFENNRMVFNSSSGYFAESFAQIPLNGVVVVGGCCGTTPDHIRALSRQMKGAPLPVIQVSERERKKEVAAESPTSFNQKLQKGEFCCVAELDPPYSSDMTGLAGAAQVLQQTGGVDAVTFSDSPMARVKIDSVACAARIARETGLEVIPHLCCRDKNVNALKASVLAAHSEGIRTLLAVTGDPIPELTRGFIKPVFNVYAAQLMEQIGEMNRHLFEGSEIQVGGAYNVNAVNGEAELNRLQKKLDHGATFVLTQPVFEDRHIERLQQAKRLGAKVFAGLLPLVSYRNVQYLNNEVPGMSVPPHIAERFTPDMEREEATALGISIAAEVAKKIMGSVDGLYIMTPFNRSGIVVSLLEQLKLSKGQPSA